MPEIKKININDKLGLFKDYWNPRVLGELNGQHVKIVKFKGQFDWHKHINEDEMFLVIKGSFTMELRDKTLDLNEGEFIIIPKRTEHRPVAKKEVHVMLFEPKSTTNTGTNPESEFTKLDIEKI